MWQESLVRDVNNPQMLLDIQVDNNFSSSDGSIRAAIVRL